MNIKFVIARYHEDDSDVIKNYLSVNKLEYVNEVWHGHSIFEKYNKGIESWIEDIESPLKDDDIICFMHEDIKIHDKDFYEKVNYIFSNRKDVGVLGVIGTKKFPQESGWWLTDPKNHTGHIYQGRPDLSEPFHMVKKKEYSEEVVSIDGCIFFVRGFLAKELRFDDTTFGGYHFYDCDYCFSALEKGFKVAVADILVEHLSHGPLSEEWFHNRNIFIEKWKSRGISFPVTQMDFVI